MSQLIDESVSLDTMHDVREVARRLGLKPSTIRRMIVEKKIDVFRPSLRAVRISEATIKGILARGYIPAVSHPNLQPRSNVFRGKAAL